MRRRLATTLSAALLGAALLLPMTASAAAATETADVEADVVVLATQGAGSDAGLEPMGPDEEDNEFAPTDYEANVTWRANNYLFALVLGVALLVGLLYWVKVARPRQRSGQS